MIPNSPTIPVPIKTEEDGTIRVSGTRVTLDTILNYYLQGHTPERLHEGFDTVRLADIYAVITYYLSNRDELDKYLNERKVKAAELRHEIEQAFPPKVTMADLQERFNTQKKQKS